jgi:cytosine deaminase
MSLFNSMCVTDYLVQNCRPISTSEFAPKGPVDIEIHDGVIDRIVPAGDGDSGSFDADQQYDADGRVVSPTLVEPHTHLFSALTAGIPRWNQSATLEEGWRLWEETREQLDKADYKRRAKKVLRWFAVNGITRVRTHIDVNTGEEAFTGIDALLEVKDEMADTVDLQIVAFPMGCLHTGDEALLDRYERSLERGLDVAGGIPHREHISEDGAQHVRTVLDLAEQYDVPVDVHIDETDDPGSRNTGVLASETLQRGLGERVTASHTTALHSYPNAYADKLVRLMAESGLSVVTNPMANAVLQGRYDDYPRRRGHTRIKRLREEGVTVGIGQDDIADHFHSYGDGDPLKTAFVLVHFAHMNGSDDVPALWDMLINGNAEVYGLGTNELTEGEEGSIVVYDSRTAFDTLRTQPVRPLVLKRGTPIAHSERTATFDGDTTKTVSFDRGDRRD